MTDRLGLGAALRVRQVRDLSVWLDGHGGAYVVACDANAGIGSRAADYLQRLPEEAGYSAAKVALMEVCAAGAKPLLVLNALCLSYDEYGSRIVDGIRNALAETGSDIALSGSDETNMQTVQTGVGVTVIGFARIEDILLGAAHPDDVVLCAGVPRSGLPDAPYDEGQPDVAAPRDVLDVLACGAAHEVLPVGSKGVLAELRQLAATAGLGYELEPAPGVPIEVSAGASTCFLVACDRADVEAVAHATRLPVHPVATLRRV